MSRFLKTQSLASEFKANSWPFLFPFREPNVLLMMYSGPFATGSSNGIHYCCGLRPTYFT